MWCLLHKNEFLRQNCHQGSNDIRHELVSIFLIEKPIDTSYMSVHHTWACNFYFILIKMIVLMCEKCETFQGKLLLLIHIKRHFSESQKSLLLLIHTKKAFSVSRKICYSWYTLQRLFYNPWNVCYSWYTLEGFFIIKWNYATLDTHPKGLFTNQENSWYSNKE